MSRIYVRSDRIKDVVFNVKLHIPEWKVLFAVDGKKDSNSLASFLELPETDVRTTLEKLQEMQLVSAVEMATEPQAETPPVDGGEEIGVSEITETLEEVSREPEPETLEESVPDEQPAEPDLNAGIDVTESASEGRDTESPISGIVEEPQEEVSEFSESPVTEEEEFDQLIGNLLEEDSEVESAAEADMSTPTIEEVEDTKTELEGGKEDFDLDSIFQEEMAESETTMENILEMSDLEVAEEEVESSEEPPVEAVIPGQGEPAGTILVVDDSVVIRKMVEIALENENYNIVSVATGKDALNYLDENSPDLIILDIMLTDMNGLDVLKAIKASKDIPVVMLSAKDTPRETTKAKQLGADDFIPKPFKDEELVAKIKELVKR